ncbi:hypothetical protein JXA88_07070 [Candidatus Fermentibacteria bacterium]|nr:hypothetical protein [Candidatus Fermentibacteria bacterium]
MPVGLPVAPPNPEKFMFVPSPPLTLWVERGVWDEAMRRNGHVIVSLGEWGRFRLRLQGEDAGHAAAAE